MNDKMDTEATKGRDKEKEGSKGKVYLIFVDGQEYTFDHSPVTGREIMDAAGIPHGEGLLLINEDGTQEPIGLDDAVELKPGRSVVRAPKFKRG